MPLLITPILLILATLFGEASPPVALSVRPQMAFAPRDVHFRVRVEPHPLNRILCIQAVSAEGISTQSCKDLEGDRAPRTHEQWFKAMPAGEYDAQAYVIRAAADAQFTALIPFRLLNLQ